MYLIVGLGNPEPEYSMTRHNMGFNVINEIAEKYDIKVEKQGFKALYGTGIINNQKVILCKPQTFMNLSGDSIIEFVNYYKIDLKNVIVIYDDIDIEPTIVRVRAKGSAGSHNGMKSVVERLGTENFPRIRIGIGKPEEKSNLINYVIGKLSKEEYELLSQGITTGMQAVEEILDKGIDNAMNIINIKS
jgi:PTH1 family peptidyl-tRNA hydrolase